jgi:hypothetical protein
MEHELQRIECKGERLYQCKVCLWEWKSKPQSMCPGVPRYAFGCQPPHLKTVIDLHKKNLKPKVGAEVRGCVSTKKFWEELFDEKDCEIDNPTLPPVYSWDERGELKTAGELREEGLVPTANPRGVAWVWDKEDEWGVWIPLYHRDDCQRGEGEGTYITKTALKQKYLLSDSWIKKLGKPDKLFKNPRGKHPIQLYHRLRIQQFLSDNATEYAAWLDRRQKYLEVFERNKDKILEKRALVKQQTAMCLRCASGCSTPQGFFCAIYPMGVQYMPCPDWVERSESGRESYF